MKNFILILFVLCSLSVSSQQILRGYTATYSYGLLSTGDNFKINYEGDEFDASARLAVGSSIQFGFPFDYGVGRHRLSLTPGIDILNVKYHLDVEPDIYTFGTDSDSLHIHSMVIMPYVGIMYKYHFFAGPLHLALGFGIDAKIPLRNDISLRTKDKTEIFTHDSENVPYQDFMTFQPNTVYSNLENLAFHISPRVGLDVFITRYLVTNIFYYTSPLTSFSSEPVLRGFAGFGATYLVPFGKEDDSRLLQYYKN